jgi:hypothetical protein
VIWSTVLRFNTMIKLKIKKRPSTKYVAFQPISPIGLFYSSDHLCFFVCPLQTLTQLRNLSVSVIAVLPGAETGVELADKLSHNLELRTNGIELTEARRNKYVMGETVRNAGKQMVA